MECKAPIPFPLLKDKNLHPIIQVYFEFTHLKQLYRQGWLLHGIERARCESVAEHSFGVAVLGLLIADAYFPELDPCKVLRLALLHDFGEIYAGDIVPSLGVAPEEKERLERESVAGVFGRLPQGEAYLQLWEEYEAGATAEARFVKQLDRLEMAMQAHVYEHQGLGDLAEFYESARLAMNDPQFVELLDALIKNRDFK